VLKLTYCDGNASVNAPPLALAPAKSAAGVVLVKLTEKVAEVAVLTGTLIEVALPTEETPLPPGVMVTLPEKLPFGLTVTLKGAVESMVALLGSVSVK
jgi:hypothetical protein